MKEHLAAANRIKLQLRPEDFASPILDSLNDMAVNFLGLRLVIVYPTKHGMDQILVGSGTFLADFCKLIQGSHDGAEHCRMCHLLMAQTSQAGSSLIKRCHTGVSALVKHISGEQHSSLAILTSCTLIDEDPASAWKIIERRGRKLGIDGAKLKIAHQNLRKLDPEKVVLARHIMDMAAHALKLILDKLCVEAELEREKIRHTPDAIIAAAIEEKVGEAISSLDEGRHDRERSNRNPSASLIDIVTEMVAGRPNLPFRIPAIAAACRITPNHFSHLFHQQHNQCFSEFLTEKRLEMAKALLKDLTLNVSQVAAGAGFQDAGYFARRFRQKTGVSPREWRQKLSRLPPATRINHPATGAR